ncbi:MAG: type II toxin-antitoxin system VapC family toxin [Thermoleophilaceae bacterium]|nr:type II toxin-antitoxin system VapC family toxin [Thermoleophilaceae bacterium]
MSASKEGAAPPSKTPRVYVDTNVFLYAIGTEHRYRDVCQGLVRALGTRSLRGETSVETLQEIVHHRRRRGDTDATERGRQALALCHTVHTLDATVALASLDLIDRHPSLPTRDAVHAATALANGIVTVLSADQDFDGIAGLTRVDPLDGEATAALGSSG